MYAAPPRNLTARRQVLTLPGVEKGVTVTSAALARRPVALERTGVARVFGPVALFALVTYLGFAGGGYDVVSRGEVGIALWWGVILAALLGILSLARVDRVALVALGLLAAFVLWCALSLSWTESHERTLVEVGRVATYLAMLALVVALRRHATAQGMLIAFAAAVTVIAAAAVGSRVHPSWFPANETPAFLPGASSRLSYPLNYWNALAALMGLGMPALLAIASAARSVLTRAAAAAAIPCVALCAYLTLSRGGVLEIGTGVVVFLALTSGRVRALAYALPGAAAAAIAIGAVTHRQALSDGLTDATARQQGDEVLAILIAVAVGAALVQAAIALLEPRLIPARSRRRRRRSDAATVGAVGALAVVAAAIVIALSSGFVADRWDEFKANGVSAQSTGNGPPASAPVASRLGSASGEGRYQFWSSALDALDVQPVHGIGPGTFEFWWARHAGFFSFVHDAHSLYFQTLAETGLVGFALLVGFLLTVLAGGARGTLRAPPTFRPWLAAATAGCFAFAVAAAFDWVWQVGVIPIAFMALAGVALIGARPPRAAQRRAWDVAGRALTVIAGLAAVAAIAVPVAMTSKLRESRRDAARGDLAGALDAAASARRIESGAATVRLQEAVVAEASGDQPLALARAGDAVDAEPTNWRTWMLLSRVQAAGGQSKAAVRSFERARSLNPQSPVFLR